MHQPTKQQLDAIRRLRSHPEFSDVKGWLEAVHKTSLDTLVSTPNKEDLHGLQLVVKTMRHILSTLETP